MTTFPITITVTDSAGASASASTSVTVNDGTLLTIGNTTVINGINSGDGNALVANRATLAQRATLQSLSFYVGTASGKLRLGLYDATGAGGNPGKLTAATPEFTPVVGWNTINVSPVLLQPGNYWLAYAPQNNALAFRTRNDIGKYVVVGFTYGALPINYPASVSSGNGTWSFYATLSTGGTVDTVPPSVPAGVTATAVSSSQINLTWTASTDNVGVAGYAIFRDGVQITTSTSTLYFDTGLSPSTLYSYAVVAFDASGNVSNRSAVASATTQTPAAIVFLAGLNYPWNSFGGDFVSSSPWGDLTDFPKVTTDLAAFKLQGVKLLRWWFFADGRLAPLWNANGTVSRLPSSFLTNIDTLLSICAANNIYLIPSLIDSWGMFSLTGVDQGGGVIAGGHTGIVTNSTIRQSFLDNAVLPLLQHVAASPNKKYVYAWEIVNEPEAQIAGGYNGASFFTGPAQFALSDFQNFVRIVTTYIHANAPGSLVTLGSAMPIWTPLWIGLGLDLHQAHYYDWMDFSGPGSGLTPVSQITKDDGVTRLDAPCILGEFATAGAGETYGLNDTAVHSARWYMDQIFARGYIGAIPWSLTAGDSASRWSAFQPVYTNWVSSHNTGP